MRQTLAYHLSSLLTAMENCQKRIDHPISNDDKNTAHLWFTEHRKTIERLIAEYMPSGSGFDEGTHLWEEKTMPDRLVFGTSFHHMNDFGMYDGWTRHEVYVTPTFTGLNLRITGKNRNDIKDHIHDAFVNALETEVDI